MEQEQKHESSPPSETVTLAQVFNSSSKVALTLDEVKKVIFWSFGALASVVVASVFVVNRYNKIESQITDSGKTIEAVQSRLDTIIAQTSRYPVFQKELDHLKEADDAIRADIRSLRK